MVLQRFMWLTLLIILASCNNSSTITKQVEKEDTGSVNLKEAFAKYPDSLLILEKLIQFYRGNGNYDSALTLTDNAIKRDSEVAELWDIKATLHYENADTLGSINAFERAINIYALPEYIISLGILYAETRNPKALQLSDALILGNKSRAEKEALFIKGLYYNYTGNKKKAIQFFDSSINVDYTYMFAYREKAVALYDLGKYTEAIQVLTKAVTVQNNFDEGYFWLGKCNEKLNMKSAAIENYQMALMYDKDYVEAKEALHRLGAR